jgi:hypothetical protein
MKVMVESIQHVFGVEEVLKDLFCLNEIVLVLVLKALLICLFTVKCAFVLFLFNNNSFVILLRLNLNN